MSNKTQPIKNLNEADAIAERLGLVRGRGKHNGQVFWVRPGQTAIVTRQRLAELAGLV